MSNAPLFAIEEFCETGSGGTPSRTNERYFGGTVPWVKSGELREAVITDTEEKLTDLGVKESSAKVVPQGSILVAMYGATVGRTAILGIDAATNQAVCSIRPNPDRADIKYLFHALQSKMEHFIGRAAGGAQPNISQGIIRETKIPLPPLDEQRRIAAILDKADVLRRNRKRALEILDGLTRSIFLEMFGDPVRNDSGWCVKSLGEISNCRLGKMLDQKKVNGSTRYPYLANYNVQWNRLEMADLRQMEFNEKEREEFELIPGDLLVCEGGEIGRCAIWRGEVENCYYQKALHRVRCDPRYCLPEFVLWYFWFMSQRGGLSAHTSVATIAHLTGVKLKSLPVPLPPLSLQWSFAAVADAIRIRLSKVQAASHRSDNLFSSLQHRAFTGQL